MGKFFDSCPQNIIDFIQKQHLFWVATAPLSPDGTVSCSPKGANDCFHVVNPNRVWYEDLSGTGAETISHIRENRRITVLFNALEGPPRIVRLFGKGTVYEYGTPEYEEFIPRGTRKPGSRAAIVIDVHRVGVYCGYSIPCYDYKGERTTLHEYNARIEGKADPEAGDTRMDNGIRAYWAEHNMRSVDGLPGILYAPDAEEVPRSAWKKEDVKDRVVFNPAGKKKDASTNESGVNANGSGRDKGLGFVFDSGAEMKKHAATFVMGVLATLLCARLAHLSF